MPRRHEHSNLPVRVQFFLTYATMGSLLPFLSVFLRERGLSDEQIGYVTAASSLGPLVTPAVVTLLADAAVAGRRLLSGIFVVSGLMVTALLFAHGFWTIFGALLIQSLAFAPVVPLQDGIQFITQRRRAAAGLPVVPYHAVRVWGTVGYIVPSVVLYFVLGPGDSVAPAMAVAAVVSALALGSTLALPDTSTASRGGATGAVTSNGNGQALAAAPGTADVPEARPGPSPAGTSPVAATEPLRPARLPTLAAARALLEPHVLVFCVAMGLVIMAGQCYYQFYALYLTEELGIDKRWVGLIQNIGVVGEIFYVLSFGWLVRTITLRGVIIVGVCAIAVRMALLGFVPSIGVAIGTQVLHGMGILATLVAPPVFLNGRAGDAYRNSMQGLYTMSVSGTSRILGSLLAGQVAGRFGLEASFRTGAALATTAAVLLIFAFHERRATAPAGGGTDRPGASPVDGRPAPAVTTRDAR